MKKLTKSDLGNELSWFNKESYDEQHEITKAFNWYNYTCDKKDAKEFVLDYLKATNQSKATIAEFRSIPESKYSTQFGWLARMFLMGFKPSEKTKKFFTDKFKEMRASVTAAAPAQFVSLTTTASVEVTEKQKPNIQDRIKEKVAEEAGAIEGLIDDYILGGFKNNVDMNTYFRSRKIPSMIAKQICDIFIRKTEEIEEVITTKDPQIKEGYSNFSRAELRKFKEFLDAIVSAANKSSVDSKPIRKKRKLKEKPAALVVSKLNYQKEFSDLKLVSVAPEKIVGASQVWLYNTKTKILSVYNAENAKGLAVKGSTLQNYNTESSVGKRLRKPEVTLPDVLGAGKIRIKKIVPELSTKELPLTGRVNSDTIILRVL